MNARVVGVEWSWFDDVDFQREREMRVRDHRLLLEQHDQLKLSRSLFEKNPDKLYPAGQNSGVPSPTLMEQDGAVRIIRWSSPMTVSE